MQTNKKKSKNIIGIIQSVLILILVVLIIFMITIKNRYEGELNYKDSDLPETTKSVKEHGIGLHNIRRVARIDRKSVV